MLVLSSLREMRVMFDSQSLFEFLPFDLRLYDGLFAPEKDYSHLSEMVTIVFEERL